MKKYIITIVYLLTMIAAPALAGVWVAQSSYGPTCYLVKFTSTDSAVNYGTLQLIGTGVVSGSTFTGFLKFTSHPMNSNGSSSPSFSDVAHCFGGTASAQTACAWKYATNYMQYNSGVGTTSNMSTGSVHSTGIATVAVKDMPITSAQPIACW